MPKHVRKKSRPTATRTAAGTSQHGAERLQKILAAAGLGSRRECEELIEAGRVEVDRRTVSMLGSKANPYEQEIRVDGEPLPRPKLTYYMVNKPTGIVSTNADPAGRPRVIDLVPPHGHMFAIGRLDMSSEGLILVTNDGELTNRLTHPRYEIEKTYIVEVAGRLEREQLDELRKGVYLAEGFARVVGATIKKQHAKSTLVEIVLKEGRNREIRRLLARVGHKVLRLTRIAIGPLRLGDLPTGAVRPLTFDELEKLRAAAMGEKRTKSRRPSHKPGGRRTSAAAKPAPKPKPAAASPYLGAATVIGGDYSATPKRAKPTGRKPAGRKPAGRKPGGRPSKGRPS